MTKNEKHGAIHTAGEKDKLQAIHDHSASLGADCGTMDAAESKAIKYSDMAMGMPVMEVEDNPPDDVRTAAIAIANLCDLMEAEDDEPADLKKITGLIRGLMAFIEGELTEAESGEDPDDANKKAPAIVKTVEKSKPELNTSYAKSLGIQIPELAVKFTGRDVIKSYTFLWGDPNKVDVEREYFTPETDFWDATQKNTRWLTWDHGQDVDFKADTRIGTITDFGDDEVGRWYEAKLDRAHKYRKMIDKLIEEGALGTSSDSAPQYVVRQKTGKSTWLKQWPWFASALTDVPCEPRMIGSIEVLKSLGVILPDMQQSVAWEWNQKRIELAKLNIGD